MNNSNIIFPNKECYLILHGSDNNNIECLVSTNKNPKTYKNTDNSEIVAIICHPHPLYDGTMHNKVVYTTHKALQELGCHTIRFNFRGVGKSTGTHDYSNGEVDDLITIIKWVLHNKPNSKIILAGFSFGAFIAFKASKIIDKNILNNHIINLISIAPAIHHQDYDQYLFNNKKLNNYTYSWLIIMGDQDEIVPPNLVFDWAEDLEKHSNKINSIKLIKLIKLKDTSHFFHGKLTELKKIIINNIAKYI